MLMNWALARVISEGLDERAVHYGWTAVPWSQHVQHCTVSLATPLTTLLMASVHQDINPSTWTWEWGAPGVAGLPPHPPRQEKKPILRGGGGYFNFHKLKCIQSKHNLKFIVNGTSIGLAVLIMNWFCLLTEETNMCRLTTLFICLLDIICQNWMLVCCYLGWWANSRIGWHRLEAQRVGSIICSSCTQRQCLCQRLNTF